MKNLSDDEINDLIDEWHDNESISSSLHEWLGMTWDEYSNWVTKYGRGEL